MPLTVKNQEPNTTVFAKDMNGSPLRITWGASGQHNDTQRVPDSFAEDIDFLNSLEQGILVVTDGPQHLLDALKFETSKVRALREDSAKRAMDSLDRAQDRDILSVQCIGPAAAGRSGRCDRPLLVKSSAKDAAPPLCDLHRHLSDRYYLSEFGSAGEGATESTAGVVRHEWRELALDGR